MLSIQEAIKKFNHERPGLTVTKAAEYKTTHYLLNAVYNTKEIDFGTPFYLVDKSTGKITDFVVMSDLKGFSDAIHNHEIDLRNSK